MEFLHVQNVKLGGVKVAMESYEGVLFVLSPNYFYRWAVVVADTAGSEDPRTFSADDGGGHGGVVGQAGVSFKKACQQLLLGLYPYVFGAVVLHG